MKIHLCRKTIANLLLQNFTEISQKSHDDEILYHRESGRIGKIGRWIDKSLEENHFLRESGQFETTRENFPWNFNEISCTYLNIFHQNFQVILLGIFLNILFQINIFWPKKRWFHSNSRFFEFHSHLDSRRNFDEISFWHVYRRTVTL